MMRSIAPFSLFALAAFLCFALLPDIALAVPDCSKYPGLTNHIAGCVRDTLDETSTLFFDKVGDMLLYPAIAMVTIFISVVGVMAAFGMLEKAGRDSMMIVLKASAVIFFISNSQDIYNFTLLAMDSSAEAVVSFIPTTGKADRYGNEFDKITCFNNMTEMQGTGRNVPINALNMSFHTASVSGPWLAMDCMVDSIIGIHVAKAAGSVVPTGGGKAFNDKLNDVNQGVSRGLFYLFFSSMQTSVSGMFIAIIGFVFLWGLVNIIIRAMFVYIAGYIGVAVLVIFAPLFIPMVLFQSTKSYFDKWVKLIISFALQPVIILVFVSFSIAAVDLAVFSGKYSVVYRIAGDESQESNFSLNEYLTRERSGDKSIIQDAPLEYGRVKADNVSNIELAEETADSMAKGLDNSKCTKALIASDPKIKEYCKQSFPLFVMRKEINWELMADERKPELTVPSGVDKKVQMQREINAALIFAGIVVFIMGQLLALVPEVTNDLLGDFKQSGNLGSLGAGPGKGKLREFMQKQVGGFGKG